LRTGRGSAVQIVHYVKNGIVTRGGTARRRSLRRVQSRMRKIATDRHGSGNDPLAILLCKSIGELHGPGAVLHMKFDQRLCMIAIHLDLLHFRVEGLEAQVCVMGKVRLDRSENRVIGGSVPRSDDRSVRHGIRAVLASRKA